MSSNSQTVFTTVGGSEMGLENADSYAPMSQYGPHDESLWRGRPAEELTTGLPGDASPKRMKASKVQPRANVSTSFHSLRMQARRDLRSGLVETAIKTSEGASRGSQAPITAEPSPKRLKAARGRKSNQIGDSFPSEPPENQSSVNTFVIPSWDQWVVEYLFPGAFDRDISFSEFVAVGIQVGTLTLNVVMAAINVFSNDEGSMGRTFEILALSIFVVELAVIAVSIALMGIVIGVAICTDSLGTSFVVDLVDLSDFGASFSVLRCVAYGSSSRMTRSLGGRLHLATGVCDYLKVLCFFGWWCLLFGFATAVVALKVTQVDFVFQKEITSWSWAEYIQLFGLVNNLGGIDLSYSTKITVLLAALHQHFCGVGGPASSAIGDEGVFTRIKRKLGLETRSYEYLESIFDTQFRRGAQGRMERFLFAMNFMAFILRMDALKLQVLLQMTRSPLAMYSHERESFRAAVQAGDVEEMWASLARADPLARLSANPMEDPRLVFICDNPSVGVSVEEEGVKL